MTALHAPPSVGTHIAHIGGMARPIPDADIEEGCMVLWDDMIGTVESDPQDGWVDVRMQTGRLKSAHVAWLSRVVMERR